MNWCSTIYHTQQQLVTAARISRSLRPILSLPSNFFPSPNLRHSSSSTTAQVRWGPPLKGTKVHVCMSGGVDSSVTARLLLEQGYEVAPVYMRNWETLDEDSASGGCEWEKDWEEVSVICREALGGVKPTLVDLSKEYWADVFQPALDGWENGLTPNPDVTCNRKIKFGRLPQRLLSQSPSSWLATGHYARLLPSPHSPSSPSLYRASHLPKDQSYYLSTSPIDAFRRTMFPIGEMTKEEVKELAKKWNLHTALKRKESMGICFVGVRKRFARGFLDSYLEPKPGNIVTEDGKIVGTHTGLWAYTEGEKARLSGFPEKMYVGGKNVKRNEVVVVPSSSSMLRCTAVTTPDFTWISPLHPSPLIDSASGWQLVAQTRSLPTGALSDCTVRRTSEGLLVELETPIVGVSPGQAVVFYDGEECLGGGTISATRTLYDLQKS